jgi:uncharacterized membrane protein HdeD (DUF308 family)
MEEVGRSWAWVLFFGFLTFVIGILVMVWPQETLKLLAVLFALQMFVVGIFSIVRSFSAGEQHRVWTVFLGIFSIIVAIIVIRNVAETVVVLTLILGIYWVIHGIIQFIMATADKMYPQRAYTMIMAVVSVIAGIVLLAWPIESVTVLAWIMGVWLVILGILGIILAFMVRSAAKEPGRLSAA